jgi:hypothetical protein
MNYKECIKLTGYQYLCQKEMKLYDVILEKESFKNFLLSI